MQAPDENNDRRAQDTSTRDDVGDVETAGETTAAATVGGDTTYTRPVGADTLVEVADSPETEVDSAK